MAYRAHDVVTRALDVLDAHGLADLTMRRLGKELGVQPSALYHHFANKQSLLAAVADEILTRGARPVTAERWQEQVFAICTTLRDSLLAYRDGAEVVATVHAFGLGATQPRDALSAALGQANLKADDVSIATRTLLHFVYGHTIDEQTHLQADSAGALGDEATVGGTDRDFASGLELILDGITQRSASELHA
ncbi:TetR/AcrR family transcriptional regulator C-terminal domain-containing protein [Nocardioides sp. Bht2]|uniref:TetR/AcrR family transcriptional regulator C-terminal domain-containing protein n=1 Tax=Nocardioides sp. Bht2 TaxID=3392297 RepID=UPI0039B5006E